MGWKSMVVGLMELTKGAVKLTGEPVVSTNNRELSLQQIQELLLELDNNLKKAKESEVPAISKNAKYMQERIQIARNEPFKIEDTHIADNGVKVKIYAYTRVISVTLNLLAINWLYEMQYVSPLQRKYKQLVYKDDYGDWVLDDWFREIDQFIRSRLWDFVSYVRKSLPERSYNILVNYSGNQEYFEEDLHGHIEGAIFELNSFYDKDEESLDNFSDVDDPYEFERRVATFIEEAGWESRVTKGSGDQGADVLATAHDGTEIVFQCKLYSKPVGNKAVQEAIAARIFYQADLAVVISNQGYTKSAKQLAENSSVYLLHYEQLPEFIEIIDGGS